MNTLSKFPSGQCVMGLKVGRGGGGKEDKVNNFSSLGFELNRLEWVEWRQHIKMVTVLSSLRNP